jgi:serine/threonine-protein kinase
MLPGNVPVGRRIRNRYRVLGYLGGGENGRVYEVWDERQDQRCALKMLNNTFFGTWAEARVLTGLRGDYILPILNTDDEGGVAFIVTEVMENGSTEDHIVQGVGARVDEATEWVRQAAIGIARVHDSGLIHMDIKAGNLFLDEDRRVLVGDFGLANPSDANGVGSAGGGSPETMAPEIAAGGLASVRTDVYSLGATLYHLLTGDWMNPALRPLTDWNQLNAAVAAHGAPRPLGEVAPHVPVGLGTIVMKAIDPDPSRRYATSDELAAALGARTRPARTWTRDQPCSGHTTCFTGIKAGASTFKVCAVPTGSRGRHIIESRRIPAGTRVNPWPEVTAGQLAAKLSGHLRQLRQ